MFEPLVSPFAQIPDSPVQLFEQWWDLVQESGQHAPDAMSLATACSTGRPAVRYVLFKAIDDRGIQFFTNFNSPKARDLDSNPFAAVAFYWGTQERQVRIEGAVEKLSDAENDAYWKTRPRGSQVGGIASLQSSPLENRDLLLKRVEEIERRYSNQDIPRPDFWGGYRIKPNMFEFWQGRLNRIHDRLRYSLSQGQWSHSLLFP